MPASNRSVGRNVHIYDANDPATVLGGLILTDGGTNANFYSMVDIVCFFDSQYFLRGRYDHPLHAGKYYIVTVVRLLHDCTTGPLPSEYLGSISVNGELWPVRAISANTGTHIAAFRDAIRERDGRCVITGRVAMIAQLGL